MANRRAKGEGSIIQRSDGRWMVRVDLGRGTDGKRQRKTAYTETQADAVAQLKALASRAAEGRLASTSTPTVAVFLEDWFTTHGDKWRASTRRAYRGAIDRFLTPAFGSVRLEKLSPVMVQRWLNEHKKAHGARRRITLAHAALRSALKFAVHLQLVTINAAAQLTVPKPDRRLISPLTVAQARALLAVAGQRSNGAIFSLALASGLRLGEATGLRWSDLDLETGEIRVTRQLQVQGKAFELVPLKTASSRRTLVLPAVALAALKAHRTRQLRQRLKAGKDWRETGFVFTVARRGAGRQLGTPLHPRNVLRTLHELLKAADLPRVRFHDLRHSAASLLLASGVQLAEVSKLLGHSELRLTSDVYGHLQRETAARAAERMDQVLAGS